MIRGVTASPGVRRALALRNPEGRALQDRSMELHAAIHPGSGDADPITSTDRGELRLPGDLELHQLCANARRLARICDTVGIPSPATATYDPDPPYIWDV